MLLLKKPHRQDFHGILKESSYMAQDSDDPCDDITGKNLSKWLEKK